METNAMQSKNASGSRKLVFTTLIILALAAFIAMFVLADGTWFRFADAHFPRVGSSTWLANLWGVVSRVHLLVPMLALVIWRPGLFGFRAGEIRRHWRMLLLMLLANCGVIAAYLLLTGSSTPYSGNQWLLTEVVTVPLVEEIFWRGLVFGTLLLVLRRFYPEKKQRHPVSLVERNRFWAAARQ